MLYTRYFSKGDAIIDSLEVDEDERVVMTFDQSSSSTGCGLFAMKRDIKNYGLRFCGYACYVNEKGESINVFKRKFMSEMFNNFAKYDVAAIFAEEMYVEQITAAKNLFYMEAATSDLAAAINRAKYDMAVVALVRDSGLLSDEELNNFYINRTAGVRLVSPYKNIAEELRGAFIFNTELLELLNQFEAEYTKTLAIRYKTIPIGLWKSELMHPEKLVGTRDFQKQRVYEKVTIALCTCDLQHPALTKDQMRDVTDAIGIGLAVANGLFQNLELGVLKNRHFDKRINVSTELVYADAEYLEKGFQFKDKVLRQGFGIVPTVNINYEYGVDIDDHFRRALEFDNGIGLLVVPQQFAGRILFQNKLKSDSAKTLFFVGYKKV